MSDTDNSDLSDLAKAILSGSQITSSAGWGTSGGIAISGLFGSDRIAVPEGDKRTTDGNNNSDE